MNTSNIKKDGKERTRTMIQLNKEEKMAVAERFPDVHIVRTMKGDSKRHHYYCEEAPKVIRFLNRMRGIEEPQPKQRRDRWREGGFYRKRNAD